MNGIAAMILAAGQAKRFGGGKQLALLGGKPLFLYSVDLALRAGLKPIIVVGNENTTELERNVPYEHIHIVRNEQAEQGISSSLQRGIGALGHDTRAVVVMLGDQPFIPGNVVQTVISAYEENYDKGIRIVRSTYGGKPGHPVLFDREMYPLFENISGDIGARDILHAQKGKLLHIEFPNPEWNMDIDTMDDYERARLYYTNHVEK
jgi:molybdenum cofactor cytidylyltransferase